MKIAGSLIAIVGIIIMIVPNVLDLAYQIKTKDPYGKMRLYLGVSEQAFYGNYQVIGTTVSIIGLIIALLGQ